MAKAASRCCELANPAQMRQIASQTGDLLRRMRFVAGRGAAAESHREDVAGQGRCGGEPSGRCCWQGKRKSERKSLPLRRSRCDAADAQQPLRCSRCTEAVAMQHMHRSHCDATDAQKQLRWAPERNGELAPIVGTEKATRHRGLCPQCRLRKKNNN